MARLIAVEDIESKIFQIRGKKVMLDRDLATLYGVETKYLTRQVRRNIKRFPNDFMFQLSRREYQDFLRCHFGTLKRGEYSKYLPYAFTEQGVAMLSSVLNSEQAIKVNLEAYVGLKRKIEMMERKYNGQFKIVFRAIKKLLEPPSAAKKRRIGFHAD